MKILGTYLGALWDSSSPTAIEYLSGYHWQKLGLARNSTAATTISSKAAERERHRRMFMSTSPRRKDFHLGNGMSIGLRLNANNVFNSQKPTSLVRKTTVLFGQVYGRQDPRWLQFQVLFKL